MSTKPKRSNTTAETGVGDREDWILRLLYAPVGGECDYPIIGTTRLMKGLFLIDRKLEEEFDHKTDLHFEPEKYGPLDKKVYDAIEQLKARNLILVSESENYDGKKYELTDTGKKEAKELFEELSEDEQELISWIKGRHVLQSLSKLLSFVYNQYPKMAENSVY